MGCPQQCRFTPEYRYKKKAMPCADSETAPLSRYAASLDDFTRSSGIPHLSEFLGSLSEEGCHYIAWQAREHLRWVLNSFLNLSAPEISEVITKTFDGVQDLGDGPETDLLRVSRLVLQDLAQEYCGGMQGGQVYDPFGLPFKPISTICPVACGCKVHRNDDCPDTCLHS